MQPGKTHPPKKTTHTHTQIMALKVPIALMALISLPLLAASGMSRQLSHNQTWSEMAYPNPYNYRSTIVTQLLMR